MAAPGGANPYAAARDQLLSAYTQYSDAQISQVQAMRAIWAILLVVHVGILTLRVWRAVKGREQFWILRFVERARGRYLVPHALLGWTLPAILFFALQIATLSLQIESFGPTHPHQAAVALLGYVLPMILFTGLWLSAGALAVSVLLTLEGKPITSNRFLRPFGRLPGPYTFHLVLYAALIVFWAVIIVLDARMYITARSLYGQLGRLLGIIDSLLAGSFTAAMIGDATMLGTSVTSLSTTLVRRNDDILIAFLVMGTIAVALYLPFAFTLVHQLRQLAVGAKQRSAMSIGVQSHRDAQQVYAHRSILVAVHAILFLIWGGSQLFSGYWIIFAIRRGEDVTTATVIQQWGMVSCATLFGVILVIHTVSQVASSPSTPVQPATLRKTMLDETASAVPTIRLDLTRHEVDDDEEKGTQQVNSAGGPADRRRSSKGFASVLASTNILETRLDG